MILRVVRPLSAILLLGVFAALSSCGKSSKSTAPAAPSGVEQQQSTMVAKQSASTAIVVLSRTHSLVTMARLGRVTSQSDRPLHDPQANTDSMSYVYSLQGYDGSGNPVDWMTQNALVSRVRVDYLLYVASSTDTTAFLVDYHTHADATGYDSVATQYVVSATDSVHEDDNSRVSGTPWIWIYDEVCQENGVTWNKSGTPNYAVAGTITIHVQYSYDFWYSGNHYVGSSVADVVITFDGSRYASVTAGANHYTLDLVTGVVT